MTSALIDVNVILDVVLLRQQFLPASRKVLQLVEKKRCLGLLAAHHVTTIHYLLQRELGRAAANSRLGQLLHLFSVARVDDAVVRSALLTGAVDFEDAVAEAAAAAAKCDFIVTRDPRGFSGGIVPVVAPEAFVAVIGTQRQG